MNLYRVPFQKPIIILRKKKIIERDSLKKGTAAREKKRGLEGQLQLQRVTKNAHSSSYERRSKVKETTRKKNKERKKNMGSKR